MHLYRTQFVSIRFLLFVIILLSNQNLGAQEETAVEETAVEEAAVEEADAIDSENMVYIEHATEANAKALRIYEEGRPEEIHKALLMWKEIEKAPTVNNDTKPVIIDIYSNIAQAYDALNEPQQSIRYYGKKIRLENPAEYEKLKNMVTGDSIFSNLNSGLPKFQGEFVKETRKLILDKTGSKKLVNTINDADKAYGAIENLVFTNDYVFMKLKSKIHGIPMHYRRWIHKDNEKQWYPVKTDTTLLIRRARYQLKYKKSSKKDTLIEFPCHSGCMPPIILD